MKTHLAYMLCALALLGCLPAVAQITHTSQGPVDLNAKKVLQKAAKRFDNGAVAFNVAMVNKDADKKETFRTTAQVTYLSGKYKVLFGQQEIYCDGTSMWHYNSETNEVVVDKASTSVDDLMNPAALLHDYEQHFRAKFIRQEANGVAVIDLTPRSSKTYHKVRLLIDSSTGTLSRMEMHNYDGSRVEFAVSKFRSVKAAENSFAFPKDKHPGVEVVDMR
ncbi:MAG: outer membrane lipoprotein carrier protein LolA [Bacteroidales bacterium]|nr:outer membrane lipoprotein carrier protein LolA [Bacteroidales bacterium]